MKSKEVERIIIEFGEYLKTDEAQLHLDYLTTKEPKETKEILERLGAMNKNSKEFTELVLFGLLPNSQSQYAQRISIAPAFINIKKFFRKLNYSDSDWQAIATLIFKTVSEFTEHPENLETLIHTFTSNKYSKRFQCGSITPIFFALDNKFPIVNNRQIRTYQRLSGLVLGKSDKLSPKLEDYPADIKKIQEFVSILDKDYGFSEIKDMAIFDLFCFWFDESIQKGKKSTKKDTNVDIQKQLFKQNKIRENEIFEETEIEQSIQIPVEERKVIWQPKDFSIKELYDMWKEGELNLQPEFQRYKLWDTKRESKLIESAFLEVPIPPLYLAEESDGKYSVIDGQQRLWSFFDFFDGKLTLSGLLVLCELNSQNFKDLSKGAKSTLLKFTPHTIIIKKESHPDIKFEIFERFNTGAIKLNDQEIRNCIYRGAYNDLLKTLSEDKNFQFLLGLKEAHKRMIDRELILRFFAFWHTPYIKYDPPMKVFLNREMENYRNLNEEEKNKMIKVFKRSIELTKTVFGEKAFKRFILGNENDANGFWEERKINKALFDIIMYIFTNYEKPQIVSYSDEIREELIWLMTHDQDFINSITLSTNNKREVLIRFDKWHISLKEIVGYPHKEPRSFSLNLKKQFWDNNPVCALCGQQIQTIDDAELDHIDQYWRGGKTIPSNARLVHRYCNRHRGGRDEKIN